MTAAGAAGGERAGTRAAAKVPRFDYAKYLHGGAAGRRELVHGFGDALREHGCARLQGQGDIAGAAAAASLGGELLAALEEYFGLPAAALQGLVEAGAEPVGGDDAADVGERTLLVLVPRVPAGARVRMGSGDWSAVSANPAELLAVPGPALARLTAGIVPAAGVGLPEGAMAWRVCAPAGVALSPRPEFACSEEEHPSGGERGPE